MNEPVRATGVVGPRLPFALAAELDLNPPALQVEARDGFLVAGQQGVPALDHVHQKGTAAGDVVERHVVGGLPVVQQTPQGAVLDPFQGVRPHGACEALRDELLGDASPQRVEAFDLAGLQGEGADPFPEPAVQEACFRRTVLSARPWRSTVGSLSLRPSSYTRPGVADRAAPDVREAACPVGTRRSSAT